MSAIGPVSNPGRTMMASLQQAISKGMPPDQAIAYVKSMATAGLAPLADLYSMMKQFERLKQPTALPPQGGTIKDQLNQAMAQKQMAQQGQMQDPRMAQQMPQQSQMPQDTQQGLPAIQAARGGLMYASPMERGLGGLDAGSMNDAQYAAGGIVAFADGSPAGVVDVNRWTQKKADRLKELTDFRNKVAPLNYQADLGAGFGGIGVSYNPDEDVAGTAGLLRNTDPEYKILKQQSEDALLRQRNATQNQNRDSQIAAAASKYKIPLSPEPPAAPAAQSSANVPPGTKSVNTPRGPSVGGDLSINSIFGRMSKQLSEAELKAKKTPEDLVKEREDYFKEKGLDKAEAARAARLTGREKEVKDQISQDKKMSLAEAGFAMAEAAGRRGRDRVGFLGAAATGGQKYAASTKQANKENRALTVAIQDQQDALATATELRKRGDYDTANDVINRAIARVDAITSNMSAAQIQVALSRASEEAANERARIAAGTTKDAATAKLDQLARIATVNDSRTARLRKLLGDTTDERERAAIEGQMRVIYNEYRGAVGGAEIKDLYSLK